METPEDTETASQLSTLELLPLEILQSIFLLSENLNLPRASLHIGSALASTHIRTELVLRSFGRAVGDLNTIFWGRIDNGDTDLQSTLLRQKWLTYAFFKHCQKTFMLRYAIQLYQASATGLPKNLQASTIADMTEYFEDYYDPAYRLRRQLKSWLRHKAPFANEESGSDWSVHEGNGKFAWTAGNGSEYLISLAHQGSTMHMNRPLTGPVLVNRPTGFDFPYAFLTCEIPEKLLHGPWTNERGQFLMLLLNHGCRINWIEGTSGEVAIRGLEDAIREDNAWAVQALVSTDPFWNGLSQKFMCEYYFGTAPREYKDSELDEMLAPQSKWRFSLNWDYYRIHMPQNIGVVPTTKHLRIAVLEKECDLVVLKALVQDVNMTSIDCDDPEIINWALQKMAEGDVGYGGSGSGNIDKGSLLLEALDGERERRREIQR